MFRLTSLICFVVVIALCLLHDLIFPCGYERRFTPKTIIRKGVHLFTTLFLPQRLNWAGRIAKLAFLLGLLSFIVLLVTGFGPLICGGRLAGWLLIVHATFAPVFIACGAVIAILAAGQFGFSKKDVQGVSECRKAECRCCSLTDSGIGAKIGFWILLSLSLPLTLTIVFSMLHWLGEDWQYFMYYAHRWCALAFAVFAVAEIYMLTRLEIKKDLKEHAA